MTSTSRVIKPVRAYELNAKDAGYRVLVDRMWPRGVKKEDLQLDAWMKELAPSTALRQWFIHRAERWSEFRERYQAELKGKEDDIEQLLSAAGRKRILLIYAAKDTEHNNAVALRDFLKKSRLTSKGDGE